MYNFLKEFQLALLGLIIAVGLIFTAFVATHALERQGIAVTGSAYEIVTSDSATWEIHISAKNQTQSGAFNEIKRQAEIVKNYLVEQGFKSENIDFASPNSYQTYKHDPKTGYQSNEVDFYNSNQTITASSDDVLKVKNLSANIQELVNKGVTVNHNSASYQYSKIGDLKVKLLEKATQDAKLRARGMLKATNDHVGKIKSVKMGVFQITSKDSNEVSDYGINNNSTVEKKVTAVANVVFEIK